MKYRALLLSGVLFCSQAFGVTLKTFDPSQYSQRVTKCDRLAGHPDDPNRVVPGIEHVKGHDDIDFQKAILVCRRALNRDPENPRIMYELARMFVYSGDIAKGLPLLKRAAEAHYPQAIFVLGALYLNGDYKTPKDVCQAADLWHESALYGRFAGQVGFVANVLDGRFKGCPVKQDRAELVGILEATVSSQSAEPAGYLRYYEGLLVDSLARELKAAYEPAAQRHH